MPGDVHEVDAYNLKLTGDPKSDDLELRTDLLPVPSELGGQKAPEPAWHLVSDSKRRCFFSRS